MTKQYDLQADDESHYFTEEYLSTRRWSTYALVVGEVLKLRPSRILEIGPGNGIVSDVLRKGGFDVKTLDFDERLKPDYVMSVCDEQVLSLSGQFDLVIASQVLEHIEYKDALLALEYLSRIAPGMILTLPHTTLNAAHMHMVFKLPMVRRFEWVGKFIYKKVPNKLVGQHYWEIGKKEHSLRRTKSDIEEQGWKIKSSFLNKDNPYHQFFLLESRKTSSNA